jgi:hypothetical protein
MVEPTNKRTIDEKLGEHAGREIDDPDRGEQGTSKRGHE